MRLRLGAVPLFLICSSCVASGNWEYGGADEYRLGFGCGVDMAGFRKMQKRLFNTLKNNVNGSSLSRFN